MLKKLLTLPILASLMLILTASATAEENTTYQDLDRNIIRAYNHNPRNTLEVYLNSMLILEKVANDKSSTAVPWELKARKLITLSCYYECTRAIDRKLYRQAYIWAKRGEKSGTVIGKIGTVPVKNLYEYLSFAGKELKDTPMVKNSSQEELQQKIEDYRSMAATMQSTNLIVLEYGLKAVLPNLPLQLNENGPPHG